MAYIRKIIFSKSGKNDGCLCDRCGQYIQNIWTVSYSDGLVCHFGIDCFEKLTKESKLTSYGERELKKAMKSIEKHREMFEREKSLTAATDVAWQSEQMEWNKEHYWHGRPWEEYHEWMLNVWYPERFKDDQKQIDRFSKVNFAR